MNEMINQDSLMSNSTPEGSEVLFMHKLGIMIFLFTVSFIFGFLPMKMTYFTNNPKLIGIANAFSGGIFICVALLHLLPEATEIFDEYFEQISSANENTDPLSDNNATTQEHQPEVKKFPVSFLLAFCGYTLILMIEKVIFDTHTHQVGDEEDPLIESSIGEGEFRKLSAPTQENEEKELDKEKEKQFITTKPVVNMNVNVNVNVRNNYNITINRNPNKKLSIPQFASKLWSNNKISLPEEFEDISRPIFSSNSKQGSISILSRAKRDRINSYLETFKIDSVEKKEEHFKNLFSNRGKISSIMATNDIKNKSTKRYSRATPAESVNNSIINPVFETGLKTTNEKEGDITSYLLLLALSIHACFEGIAIGLQGDANEIFYMFLAILFHKWVEALSIGINLHKSNIEKTYVCKFIVLFSLMTPLGMLLGIFFAGISRYVEAAFLSISAGSFIYISASEIVIEEFSVTRFKNEKIVGFLAGAAIICCLTVFEHHH